MGVDDFLNRMFLKELRQITRRITYLYVETPNVASSTISGNSATTDGGGFFNEVDSVFRFDASTGEKIAPDPFIDSGFNGFNDEFPVSNIEGLAFSTDGSTLFVGSLGSVPTGFDPAANAIYRFDPDSGMPLDGVDGNGTIIQYIRDNSATTSQGGPGTGDPMAPQRIVVLPSGLTGDMDCDFDSANGCNIDDIDLLVMEIVAGTNSANFDLTGEGDVNGADLTKWLATAGEINLGGGLTYQLADFTLDGNVDVDDFNIFNENKFTATGKWSLGDGTADGATDVDDFNLFNERKFTSAGAEPGAVPEPGSWRLIVWCCVLFSRRFRG